MQLGLTPDDMEEVLAYQREWMREEEEQEQGAGGHNMAEVTVRNMVIKLPFTFDSYILFYY
jgi:hypothetical protein